MGPENSRLFNMINIIPKTESLVPLVRPYPHKNRKIHPLLMKLSDTVKRQTNKRDKVISWWRLYYPLRGQSYVSLAWPYKHQKCQKEPFINVLVTANIDSQIDQHTPKALPPNEGNYTLQGQDCVFIVVHLSCCQNIW